MVGEPDGARQWTKLTTSFEINSEPVEEAKFPPDVVLLLGVGEKPSSHIQDKLQRLRGGWIESRHYANQFDVS